MEQKRKGDGKKIILKVKKMKKHKKENNTDGEENKEVQEEKGQWKRK